MSLFNSMLAKQKQAAKVAKPALPAPVVESKSTEAASGPAAPAAVVAWTPPANCEHETQRVYSVSLREWSGMSELTIWHCCATCRGQRWADVQVFDTRDEAHSEYWLAMALLGIAEAEEEQKTLL